MFGLDGQKLYIERPKEKVSFLFGVFFPSLFVREKTRETNECRRNDRNSVTDDKCLRCKKLTK